MINLLTSPVFDDEDKTLVAHHLFIIILTFMAVGWMAVIIAVIIPETIYRWLLVGGVIETAGLILLALNKYGHTRLVSNLLIFIIWAAATGMALTGGGISSNAIAIYFIVVFTAGLVLSGKSAIITAVLCSLTELFLVYLEYSGALPVNQVPHIPLTRWIANTIYMAIIISLQYLVSRTIRKALEQSRQELKERQRVAAALRESEGRFRGLFEQAAVGVAEVEMSTGRFITVNNRLCEIVGKTEEELLATTFQAITHPEDLHLHEEKTALLTAGKIGHYSLEKRYLRKDGGIVWVNITVSPLWKPGEATGRNIAVVEDITDRKRAEEGLRESEERYRTLVENANDIVFRLDNIGHITFVNPAALRIMRYEEKEIIGRHYPTFIRPDMQEEAMKFFGRQFVKRIPNTYSEYPVIVKDGHEIWLGQNTQLIFQDGKVVAFQAVARDITDRKRIGEALQDSENRYRELSIVDDLTQLYNSRYFYHQLKMEMDRADRYKQPLTLLLLDLDDFKRFNDTHGHVEGDQVLFRLGLVIKRCLRETDSAYRYGGEEFTILLPMTTNADGAVTTERIRTEFKKETFSPTPGQEVHVTVSIGLAQYKTQEDMKAFVHRVDQLMYQGKKNGKDRVCSEP